MSTGGRTYWDRKLSLEVGALDLTGCCAYEEDMGSQRDILRGRVAVVDGLHARSRV